jgi:hypothetical protein
LAVRSHRVKARAERKTRLLGIMVLFDARQHRVQVDERMVVASSEAF